METAAAGLKQAVGVVLDVDGVLVRGSRVIPQALPALQKLAAANIPTLFVTNSGNCTEKNKAAKLSEQLGWPINENQIILSHTPWKRLVPEYKDKKILVIGCPASLDVAKAYGFTKVVSPECFHRRNPDIYPVKKSPPIDPSSTGSGSVVAAGAVEVDEGAIHAAFIFSDSIDWGLHIQVLTDVLLDSRGEGGAAVPVPVYACNADVVYTGTHHLPRFTQGAFVHAFQSLFSKYSGQEAAIEFCGKPYKIQYDYAENLFLSNAAAAGTTAPTKYYGVGDNPRSDIRGANGAGSTWTSILVKTGVFDGAGAENDSEDPADAVADTVLEAVEAIIRDAVGGGGGGIDLEQGTEILGEERKRRKLNN
jgi:HAD superfamily hydrolase (TIGR01456 family)